MTTHWTTMSVDDFVHRLSFDFITQLAKRLESSPINRTEFAGRLGVSKGRVSQILNNPSNLTLNRAVKYARALGMKVSVVAYDDHDPNNKNGPINSEIFIICWDKAGQPTDFKTAERVQAQNQTATTEAIIIVPERKGFIKARHQSAQSRGQQVFSDSDESLSISEQIAATNEAEPFSLELAAVAAGG